MENLMLDGDGLTIEKLTDYARNPHMTMSFTRGAEERIRESRRFVEELIARGEKIYGVTTGIGELASVTLTPEETKKFQRYLIYSHAGGWGSAPVEEECVRAAIAARMNVLAKGKSGIRLEVARKVVEIMNSGIVPKTYAASVGACGDLAPMAQAMLVPMGKGEAFIDGVEYGGGEALEKKGIEPIEYQARDGLAVINGSQLTTGMGALAVVDSDLLIRMSEIAGAMTLDTLGSLMVPFDARLLEARGFRGGVESAGNFRKLTEGSEIIAEARKSGRVQDAYSLRSSAQVTGAARDALRYAREQLEIELNGCADNPVFIPPDEENPGGAYLTGANFQGSPIALPLEMLGTAVTTVDVLSERRLNRLLNPNLSNGLPGFLIEGSGLYSGIMIPQYTAASLICENRVLCHPAATGSIPVSADQEDYVSMGTITAIKLRKIIENSFPVIAIELLAAAQALEFRMKEGKKPSPASMAAFEVIRNHVPFMPEDRPLYRDIVILTDMVKSGEILEAVEKVVGKLN